MMGEWVGRRYCEREWKRVEIFLLTRSVMMHS